MSKNKIKELFNNKKARIIGASIIAGVIALGAVGYIIGMADVKVSADSKKEVEEKVVLEEKENEINDLKDKLNDENISEEEKKEIETKIAEKEVVIKKEENSTSNDNQTENNNNNDNTVAVSTPKEPTEKPSKPNNNNNAHNHSWAEQFQTINHQEQGHWEDILVSAAWAEQKPVYDYVYRNICNGCKADISNDPDAHMKEQALAGNYSCGSWTGKYVDVQVGTETINHEAVYDKKYVVDKAAWTENKLSGYKCSSCGATK